MTPTCQALNDNYFSNRIMCLDQRSKLGKGQFQGNDCVQKSRKPHFLMAAAPGANMISTNFD